jgi:acetolactate synthase-1/2/3 large subunit
MRGADALISALECAGVDTVFGMPGGASLPLYDALLDSGIRHVLMRHEAGAGHAAEGYARATGRVGVAFATSGPGATNLVTPIADAYMDSIPTLFVTGQVRTALRGTNAFQEADVIGITAPIVKHSIAVERPDDVAQAIADALHLARAGRPGPVLVDIPVDVAKGPARAAVHDPQLPGYRPRTKPNGRQVRIAAQALAAARRPVLYAGGGVVHAEAAAELTALARLTGAPVTTTLMALGTFPASDPQWLGMLGMHGQPAANWAMDEADLIVAIGARFDDRVTGDLGEFAPRAKVVHVDVDPAEIGKNVAAHVPIVGCARRALAAIAAAYERARARDDGAGDDRAADYDRAAAGDEPAAAGDRGRLADWWARIDSWRSDPVPRNGAEAALDSLDAVKGDAIVTTDVGQHQMWAANRLRFDAPRRWITSGGLGTMGFGLPAAIGAQVARPDATVVCVTGEGSLLLNVQELATAAHERLPVKLIMLDNASLGMVRQQQDMFWDGRRSEVDLGATPDWIALATAFGVAGHEVDADGDVEAAIARTLAEPGPALLRVRIDPGDDCLPMFAPGGAARAMIGVASAAAS